MSQEHQPMTGTIAGPSLPSGELHARLLENGPRFDFTQAVWLLERYFTSAAPIGGTGPVAAEAITLRPDLAVSFPGSDVSAVRALRSRGSDQLRYLIDVTFMGLYGVSTPLPLHYAVDLLREVERHTVAQQGPMAAAEPAPLETNRSEPADRIEGSAPARDFLDLVHHRLLSLFYRSCLKYRYDMAYSMAGRDVLTGYLLLMIGGADGPGAPIPPQRLIRYAGDLTQRPRSSSTLEGMLSDFLGGLPTRVTQCVGRWVMLSSRDCNALGRANATLGTDLTVGAQVFDLGGAFTVSLGPVSWSAYLNYLPDAAGHRQTRALVQSFSVDPLAFNVELSVYAAQVPELRLSSGGDAGRLGYTTWVRTGELPEVRVCFDPSSARHAAAATRDAAAPGRV